MLPMLKKFFIGLLVATVVYLLLYFLTPINDLIVLKGVAMVMIALAWLVLILLSLPFGWNYLLTQGKLKRFLSSITDQQLNYAVELNEEKIKISAPEYAYELSWSEFDCYGINGETVYVFNQVARSNSLYWDRSEMGNEAYITLLELLRQKEISRAF